ncbi:(2,3-dihydroxybenzoyl)adenylate synthase [Zavarzinia compransoris]|uniref:2,3-dihydroxybenzoate-AMP ligase n=1 Tax=Zavarzinia compransoris TaxID=1264899 RepID=A0A317DTX8_9PROT|nr:AMP-binding protein [Zavarzinia compransoris]PWR17832.1 2,3-dihydroxybenzoate-AMP ligase [Zavarzinia compransoris]TDP49366.1 2,3-dihydroxybenzoate-AMP ligase [Zavarzinia compransoris]
MIPVTQTWSAEAAARYRSKGYWRGETFGAFLRARAQATPDAVAIVCGARRWTYADFDRDSDAFAAGLLDLGLRAGDRAIVQLPNIGEYFIIVFGLFKAGILPIFALPGHRSAEITHFAEKGEAAAHIVAAGQGFDYCALAHDVRGRVPGLSHVVTVGAAGAGEVGYDDLLRAAPRDLPARDPAGVAFLQLSGGSTGLSKLIPRSHDDYIYTLRESARICGLTAADTLMIALPAAHNFPMSSPGSLSAFYVGARVVLAPSPSPDACLPLIARERVTMTSLVPPVALLWLSAAEAGQHDLSSLRVIQIGGAKLAPEVARRIRPVLGCTLQQVFGMAEGLVNYTALDDDEETIVTTQGRPISPDDEILIVDDDGRDVAPGEAGHLLTRGPYTIRAYHNDDGANARAFTADGFYRTGDIVLRRADGALVVQGRAGDHINRAGEKISAEEIEDHLLAHPQVFDAAVVSIPDEFLGERSCAFVIPRGDKPKAAALKAWIRQRGLAEFKVPDQVVFVERFTETAVGKISRKALRAHLRATLGPEAG